ncbi:MAG: cold shock domain-containing protein [Alphaproteobacteria bacterium]|nr:cold shock domain-containing protein [Alphaproteobacteria bacterium]
MAHQDQPSGGGDVVTASVKWFRSDKGYGFVTPEDGSSDVFIHVSVLKNMNLQDLPPGSKVTCEVGQGQKGRQVVRLIDVDTTTATATPTPPRRPMGDGPRFDRGGGAPGGFDRAAPAGGFDRGAPGGFDQGAPGGFDQDRPARGDGQRDRGQRWSNPRPSHRYNDDR